MSYILLTDSSADLSASLVEELNLYVLPLSVTIDGETYRNFPDEREIRCTELYAKLRGGAMATTSAVNVGTFRDFMEPILREGKDILYVGFTSGLSGTYQAGVIAAQELMQQYPDHKILTVDSLCASQGQGLLVYLVAKKIAEGASIEEAAAFAEETKMHVCHWFTVNDLFFLKRGGRVSAATAIIGSTLGIKPVMRVDENGKLESCSTVRGRKKSLKALVEHMKETATDPANQTVFIVHGDCLEDAETVAQMVRDEFGVKDIIINFVGPVIGAHSGPGTLALFYLGTHR